MNINPLSHKKTKKPLHFCKGFVFLKEWSHLGSNQGPPDYESAFIYSILPYFYLLLLKINLLKKIKIKINHYK